MLGLRSAKRVEVWYIPTWKSPPVLGQISMSILHKIAVESKLFEIIHQKDDSSKVQGWSLILEQKFYSVKTKMEFMQVIAYKRLKRFPQTATKLNVAVFANFSFERTGYSGQTIFQSNMLTKELPGFLLY